MAPSWFDLDIMTPVTQVTRVLPDWDYEAHGATYNFAQQAWSKWHKISYIQSTGLYRAENPTSDLNLWGADSDAAVTAAASFSAPITGRLHLNATFLHHGDYQQIKGLCSGFWLGDMQYFITCAHIFPRELVEAQEDRNKFFAMFSQSGPPYGEFQQIVVNSSDSRLPSIDATCVKLVNLDWESDIAVYCPISPVQDPPRGSVGLESLGTLEPDYRGPIFSVGYPAEDHMAKTAEAKQFFQEICRDPAEEAFMKAGEGRYGEGGLSVFTFLRDRYMDHISASDPNKRSMLELNGYPICSEIFPANSQCIATGMVKAFDDDKNRRDTIQEEEKGKAEKPSSPSRITVRKQHNMSSWYGCSGAMVGVVHEDNHGNHRVIIIGLVQGGNLAKFRSNFFVAFTQDTLDWLSEIVNPGSTQAPAEYGAKEFMKRRMNRIDVHTE